MSTPASGAVDGFARVLDEYLAARWKQLVVVEPRPGAASNIGTMVVKNSEPDDHTLLATAWSAFLSNPHHFKAASWSPTRDFIGAAAIGYQSTVMVVPRFSATPTALRSAGGDLGAHNHAFYVERLGLSEAEFQRLRDDAVI